MTKFFTELKDLAIGAKETYINNGPTLRGDALNRFCLETNNILRTAVMHLKDSKLSEVENVVKGFEKSIEEIEKMRGSYVFLTSKFGLEKVKNIFAKNVGLEKIEGTFICSTMDAAVDYFKQEIKEYKENKILFSYSSADWVAKELAANGGDLNKINLEKEIVDKFKDYLKEKGLDGNIKNDKFADLFDNMIEESKTADKIATNRLTKFLAEKIDVAYGKLLKEQNIENGKI